MDWMNWTKETITILMPLLVGLLAIFGTLAGAWANNRYSTKHKLKDDQIRAVKELHKRIIKAEKAFIALQVDHGINSKLSEPLKEEAKVARDHLINFYDENAIILPEKVANRVDQFVQHFVLSHASLILDNYTGISAKDALDKMTKDIKQLQEIKETLHHEFRTIIGVKR